MCVCECDGVCVCVMVCVCVCSCDMMVYMPVLLKVQLWHAVVQLM